MALQPGFDPQPGLEPVGIGLQCNVRGFLVRIKDHDLRSERLVCVNGFRRLILGNRLQDLPALRALERLLRPGLGTEVRENHQLAAAAERSHREGVPVALD